MREKEQEEDQVGKMRRMKKEKQTRVHHSVDAVAADTRWARSPTRAATQKVKGECRMRPEQNTQTESWKKNEREKICVYVREKEGTWGLSKTDEGEGEDVK